MQMEQSPKTIAQKNEELLKQQSQMDVAQGVAGVLQNKKRRSDANAKMLKGIDPRKLKAMTKRPMGLPYGVPRVQKAAQGGIVGFSEGMGVNLMPGPGEETFAQGLGSSPEGEFIAEVGTKAFEYLKNNPAEAVALGVTAIPGVGLAFKLGKGAFNIGKFLVGQGAKFVRNRPFTSAVIGGTGAFRGKMQ